ncbi:UNVERIFIED_CONTAM: DNA/RNA non-specific endonuclease [Prevotella sp. 15_C9]
MKRSKLYNLALFSYFIFFTTFYSCSGSKSPIDGDDGVIAQNNSNSNLENKNLYTHRLEFPRVKGDNNIILVHEAQLAYDNKQKKTHYEYGVNYSTEWDIQKKSQRWSCYQMYANNSIQNTNRYKPNTNIGELQYPQDPLLDAHNAFSSDPYWRSGFDHGHICPSADRLCSKEANIQTFYLTNMQPQWNSFNAGIWEKAESWLRSKNNDGFRDTLYVVKGGTIDRESLIMQKLKNGLIVPKYFYMAILAKKGDSYMAIGLWFEHKANDGNLTASYVRNIDELEELTGIDFFCNLPDDIENRIESLPRKNVARIWGLK